MGFLAEQFYGKTQKRCFANITHISNMPSIVKYGLLSYDRSRNINHVSVALEGVQKRREQKSVPNGLPLHNYASLYFDPRNPMMYRLRCHMDPEQFRQLVVLAISIEVLDIDGVVVTDGNAASSVTRFYSPEEGIASLNYQLIYAKWWNDPDNPYAEEEKKRVKCAEVLVPHCIQQSKIDSAVVSSEEIKEILITQGFLNKIHVEPDVFFL